jgi:hypothetical protein
VEFPDRARRGVGNRNVERDQLDRAAVDAAVGIHEVDGDLNAAVLVDATRSLRSGQGVHGTDTDRGRCG